MLLADAILLAVVVAITAYAWRKRRSTEETSNSVRSAGLAMLCQNARQQSSIELRTKLSSGVLVGAYKEAAELVLRERGEA
jgi:hypothetical protein